MLLTLQRTHSTRFDTIGVLTVDGSPFCYTLEDAIRDHKMAGETCIPAGTYDIGLRFSPRFSHRYGHEMLWLQNVPGFEFVLIHCGNSHADTAGCLLVGTSIAVGDGGESRLVESRKAYDRLYPVVAGAVASAGGPVGVLIEIRNPPPVPLVLPATAPLEVPA